MNFDLLNNSLSSAFISTLKNKKPLDAKQLHLTGFPSRNKEQSIKLVLKIRLTYTKPFK